MNITDNAGRTPLHWAALDADDNVNRLFLDRSADLAKLQDNDGNTPLHLAVWKDRMSTVRLIVGRDHSLAKIQNEDGDTPLHTANKRDKYKAEMALMMTGVYGWRYENAQEVNNSGYTAKHYRDILCGSMIEWYSNDWYRKCCPSC